MVCERCMMPTELDQKCESSQRLPFDENAVCESCGQFGAYRFGDVSLCQECYTLRGSCCPEFGKDDLWKFEE
jgi:hypothetical protein